MGLCNCQSSLSNTGKPGCQLVSDVAKKLILVPLKDQDGNYNEIDIQNDFVNGVLPEAFIEGKLNEADPFARWYPTPDVFENLAGEVADSIVETFDSGRTQKIQNGIETFIGLLLGLERTYVGKLEPAACVDFGVYVVTSSGDLEGSLDSTGTKLRPTRVDKGSWDPKWVPATDTASAKIQVTFNFSKIEKDADRRMITADNIGVDLLTIEGLIDIMGTITPIDNVTYTLETASMFGDVSEPDRLEGLTVADLTQSNGTVSAVVETATPGIYTVTHDGAPSTTITVSLSKTGFEMEPVTFDNPA